MTWDALLPRNAARLMRDSRGLAAGSSPAAPADVTFSFFAPRNPAVSLLGDFTTWSPQAMESDERGWWYARRRLTDGMYQYRFQVQSVNRWAEGQWVDVIDPRSPSLASDRTTNCICIADGQIKRDAHIWRHDDVPLALDEGLMPVRLTAESPWSRGVAPTWQGVLGALDEIAAAGVRAVIVPGIEAAPGLGHDPRCPFCPPSECAEPTSFKRMVDECHGRGVRVIVEMECGRGDGVGALAQIDYDYWYAARHTVNWNAPESPPHFDYARRDEGLGLFPAQEFMRACVFHWIDTYHIDGIRFLGAEGAADRSFLAQLGAEARARTALKPFLVDVE